MDIALGLGVGLDSRDPLTAFRKSKLVSVAKDALIFAAGDSTVAGYATGGGTNQVINSWPMKYAARLAARGIKASAANRFGTASGSWATLLGMDGRVTGSGAWSQNATLAPGGNSFGVSTGAAGAMNFAPQGNINKIDVYWRDGATGRNFSYAIDGGATVAVNSSGTTRIFKTTVDTGSVGSHQIALAWVAGNITILGIDAYDDTGGMPVRVWNGGISGGTSTQLIDNSDPQGGRRTFYTYMQAALMIIEGAIINDWRQNIPVATTKANLTTLVQLQKPLGQVLLMTPVFDNDMTNNGPIQEQYVTAMREVAVEQGVPLLDVRAKFQSWAYANAQGWMSDTVHPTAAGYDIISEMVDNAVAIAA